MFETLAKDPAEQNLYSLKQYKINVGAGSSNDEEDLYHLEFVMTFHTEMPDPLLFYAAFLDDVELQAGACETMGK